MTYQITMINDSGKYKPVSCLINTDTVIDLNNKEDKKSLANRGMKKICATKRWRSNDVKKFGYNRIKVRVYNKETIEEERKSSYALVCAMNKIAEKQG